MSTLHYSLEIQDDLGVGPTFVQYILEKLTSSEFFVKNVDLIEREGDRIRLALRLEVLEGRERHMAEYLRKKFIRDSYPNFKVVKARFLDDLDPQIAEEMEYLAYTQGEIDL